MSNYFFNNTNASPAVLPTVATSLKVVYLPSKEIRRFSFSNFNSSRLVDILALINPTNGQINVKYVDDEGDLVVLKEELDWEEAKRVFASKPSSLIRLQVEIPKIKEQPKAVKHEGVTCDGCEKTGFEGVRNKCVQCPDFDFCGSCFDNEEMKKNHFGGNHNFVAIQSGDRCQGMKNWWRRVGRNGNGRCPWFSVQVERPSSASAAQPKQEAPKQEEVKTIHYGIICDGCGKKPLIGTRHKATNLPDFDLCDTCFGDEKKRGENEYQSIERPVWARPAFVPQSPFSAPVASAPAPVQQEEDEKVEVVYEEPAPIKTSVVISEPIVAVAEPIKVESPIVSVAEPVKVEAVVAPVAIPIAIPANQVEQFVVPVGFKFTNQLQVLQDMGFAEDKPRVIALLEKNKGNIQRVVEALLQ